MSEQPIRILLAKIGLDGHDRGVKVLARSFRDAGFDVIYTGLWQTAQATMYAAMQEDVDLVGVSLLSAAHLTVMPEVLRHRADLGIERIPVLLGGIIPEADHPKMREMGVAAVFNPGSAVETIIQTARDLARQNTRASLPQARAGYAERRDAALAQLITHVQRGVANGDWTPPRGHARVIGITGSPGVGKSSFIGKLGAALRAGGHTVAVAAVDPTSPVTGGALLGDRLRMMTATPDEGFFVRSISSGPLQGGLGPQAGEIIGLLNGYGFDFVFVETVGAGQGDVAVRTVADQTILLLMPETGDSIQFSKAGITEIADCFVLNKCDLAGADAAEASLIGAVGDGRPIFRVSTLRKEGIDRVADWLVALKSA